MIVNRLAAAAIACAGLVACGRSTPSMTTGTPAASPAPAAARPPTAVNAPADGASQIADSADGVHIEYHVYGQGEPAVVLIHGWACNENFWREQIAPLSARYTTVTLDLAGHGGSGRNRSDWSMVHFGEDVAAVVRKIPNRRIILVGHSMGGPVALEAAPLVGPRLIGIIGIDTYRRIGLPPPQRQALERELAPFRADFIGAMQRFVPQQLFTRRANAQFVRQVAAEMAREPPQIAIAALESLNTLDYAPLLARIHVPIIAIDSDLQEPPNLLRVRKSVPDFGLYIFPGAGSFVMLEDPQHFNPVLLSKIAWLAGEHQPGIAPRPTALGDAASTLREGSAGHIQAAE